MDKLGEGDQWLFLLENITSGIPEIEIQWAPLKMGIIQELNLMGHVPIGFHSNPRQELQDYIDSLSD
jgi:hypothetical protein